MAITSELIREVFKGLENADDATLFKEVADDVDWAVMAPAPSSEGPHCVCALLYERGMRRAGYE